MAFAALSRSQSFTTAVLLGVLASACGESPALPADPARPRLIRDAADIFSAGAEEDAERRLSQVRSDHGAWVFVLTDPNPDTPRVLDRPLADATRVGFPAVGFVLGPNGLVGTGHNERGALLSDVLSQASVETALRDGVEGGAADRALERFVDRIEAIFAGE